MLHALLPAWPSIQIGRPASTVCACLPFRFNYQTVSCANFLTGCGTTNALQELADNASHSFRKESKVQENHA